MNHSMAETVSQFQQVVSTKGQKVMENGSDSVASQAQIPKIHRTLTSGEVFDLTQDSPALKQIPPQPVSDMEAGSSVEKTKGGAKSSQYPMTSKQDQPAGPGTGKKRKREISRDAPTPNEDGTQRVENAQVIPEGKKRKRNHSKDSLASGQASPWHASNEKAPSPNHPGEREVVENPPADVRAAPQEADHEKAGKRRKQDHSEDASLSTQAAFQNPNDARADGAGHKGEGKKNRKSPEDAPVTTQAPSQQAANMEAQDQGQKGKGKSRAKEPNATTTSGGASKQPPKKTKKTNDKTDARKAEDDTYQVFPDPFNIIRPQCPNCSAVFCHCNLKKQWCKCVCWSCGGRWKN